MKALIVFDLDGTLAASKSAIDSEMATLLTALLAEAKVAIISGGGHCRRSKSKSSPIFRTSCIAFLVYSVSSPPPSRGPRSSQAANPGPWPPNV